MKFNARRKRTCRMPRLREPRLATRRPPGNRLREILAGMGRQSWQGLETEGCDLGIQWFLLVCVCMHVRQLGRDETKNPKPRISNRGLRFSCPFGPKLRAQPARVEMRGEKYAHEKRNGTHSMGSFDYRTIHWKSTDVLFPCSREFP